MSTYAPARARRSVRRLLVVAAATALGLGVATQATAAPTAAHEQKVKAKIKRDTLEINGTFRSDTIVLRLKAGDPGTLELDSDGDGSADARFDRSRFDTIEVEAGIRRRRRAHRRGQRRLHRHGGDDTRRWVRRRLPRRRFRPGSVPRRLGDDRADGNRGDDTALMGFGDDTFVWDPGDGSDRVEGQFGDEDAMLFNGAGAAEAFDRLGQRRADSVLPQRRQHHDGSRRRRADRPERAGRRRHGPGQRRRAAPTSTAWRPTSRPLSPATPVTASRMRSRSRGRLRTTRSRSIRTAPRCACPAWPRRSG